MRLGCIDERRSPDCLQPAAGTKPGMLHCEASTQRSDGCGGLTQALLLRKLVDGCIGLFDGDYCH